MDLENARIILEKRIKELSDKLLRYTPSEIKRRFCLKIMVMNIEEAQKLLVVIYEMKNKRNY